jgi:mannose-1-phosphate guanylyltransferase
MQARKRNVWGIVLAGGAGVRLASLTGGVPKQFWRFEGGPTLIENTLERIAPLTTPARTVVVVDRTHRHLVETVRNSRRTRFVYQPCNRGTATGVLFGLLSALDSTEDPIVVLTPSDHGVADEVIFRRDIADAVNWVESREGEIVLFGAEPSGPDGDYGWIAPEIRGVDDSVPGFARVSSFAEKPSRVRAEALLTTGAVWNTMVMVGYASTLAALYSRHIPQLWAVFGEAVRLSPARRREYLAHAYRTLPPADFCRDLLTHAPNLWVRVWPAALGWSDLGTPQRLARWRTKADNVGRIPEALVEPHFTDKDTSTVGEVSL